MPEEPVKKDTTKCIYCGDRLDLAKHGGKPTPDGGHPGGPNACIAIALVKLRKSLTARLPRAKQRAAR